MEWPLVQILVVVATILMRYNTRKLVFETLKIVADKVSLPLALM